jgi:peptidoglycan/LPS O-acetylase OafA/YrhL
VERLTVVGVVLIGLALAFAATIPGSEIWKWFLVTFLAAFGVVLLIASFARARRSRWSGSVHHDREWGGDVSAGGSRILGRMRSRDRDNDGDGDFGSGGGGDGD